MKPDWSVSPNAFISLQWRHDSAMAYQIPDVSIVCSTVYSDTYQRRKHHWPLWAESTGDRRIPLTRDSIAGWRNHVYVVFLDLHDRNLKTSNIFSLSCFCPWSQFGGNTKSAVFAFVQFRNLMVANACIITLLTFYFVRIDQGIVEAMCLLETGVTQTVKSVSLRSQNFYDAIFYKRLCHWTACKGIKAA